MYDLGEHLLMVASDRISTYDSVHPTPIPGKGQVLTGLSVFWFELTAGVVPNHLVSATERCRRPCAGARWRCSKLEMLPIECVVRGYLAGSGWNDYRRSGAVCGIALPEGLRESERLPQPLFTPASKAQIGDHDENIDFETAVATLGDRALAERVRDATIAVYERASEHARKRGDDRRRHEVRVRPRARRHARAGRRGAHARLLALLGRRDLRAGARRSRASTSSSCATGRPRPAGTARRRRRRSPTRSSRARGALPRRLRADRRRAARGLAARAGAPALSAGPATASVVRARVLVRPKAGILDPQGAAVERALPALGFDGVSDVRVGRLIELEVDDPSRLPEMCQRLLANPLIEDYEVLLDAADEVRRHLVPGELRRRRRAARRARASARRSRCGTPTTTCAASTPWSSPAASPTATTCAPARSPASRRS